MQRIEAYNLTDSFDFKKIIIEISKVFSIKRESSFNQRQTFYDTFDWRLYNNGFTLIKQGNDYILSSLETDEPHEKTTLKSNQLPKFWWDFPDGYLKDRLKKWLDVRALLPLMEIEKEVCSIRILNEDEKTVLRVNLEQIFLIKNQKKSVPVNIIKLLPLKGYPKESSKFKNYINKMGIDGESVAIYSLALKEIGKTPGDYSSKLTIVLSPEMTSWQAIKNILRFLLQVMKQNEGGIKADVDTEFLHDFRVAIRRTRSALTQIKGVFPPEISDRFKQDFAHLGKMTNRMRDLDVYLLKKDQYQKMLPEYLRPGLDPLFDKLVAERKEEHKNLVNILESDSVQKIIDNWETFLNSEDNKIAETQNSHKPVIDIAKKFIHKKYNQVIDIGNKISDKTPDSELHQLRIECKKLRYLLEFFSSLFPHDEMTILIKQLKKLQDNLGDYNDLSVQQESLKVYLESITIESQNSLQIASAIGGLITSLYQQRQRVRKAFAQTFAEFSGAENARLYQRLISVWTKTFN